nr:RNA-directed DNA polymerase, eukaryota, nucleotide-binding alpha-beta plait domain protein [Tanacetum cinerariifolium]
MSNFPRLDALAVDANSRGMFEGMLVNCDRENARDREFANGLYNLCVELLERTNERQQFITELEVCVHHPREYSAYGTVVDVFIPLKKSQAGKRFAFVHFIKVFSLDRLVKNLRTI